MLVQHQHEFAVATRGQALIDITGKVAEVVRASAIATGQATVFIQHTSASLVIQENASPDMRRDLLAFFARLVPDGADFLTHVDEGQDDMPAHIKAALTQVSLTIPATGARHLAGHLSLRASPRCAQPAHSMSGDR